MKYSMRIARKVFAVIVALTLFISNYGNVEAASDGTNMTKVLQYYAQKKYKKASKYSKKLNKTAKETCTSAMSSKMKKSYLKIVKKYPDFDSKTEGGKYIWDYYITDIDNDKKADLLVYYGSCEADVKLILYQYNRGKAVKVASAYCGHSSFHAYPNHKGVVMYEAHMGGEAIYVITLTNGKLKSKLVGSRYVENPDNYLNLNCNLKSHSSFPAIIYDDLR